MLNHDKHMKQITDRMRMLIGNRKYEKRTEEWGGIMPKEFSYKGYYYESSVCMECNDTKWYRQKKSKFGKRNGRDKPKPFCNSCSTSYANKGKSLVDKYISSIFPDFNPSGPYVFKCKCGEEQEYTAKHSLYRVMTGSNMCGKCSKSAKRNWNVTDEYREQCRERSLERWSNPENIENARLEAVKRMGYSSLDEYYKSDEYKSQSKYRNYRKKVDDISRRNLKLHRPDEYKRWKENKWDNKNMDTLTIDHVVEVHEGFKMGLSPHEVANPKNLQVITMRENIEKHLNNS